MSARPLVPVPGHKGIATRDGKYIVRSPHRPGRPSTFDTLKQALAEQALRKGGVTAQAMTPFEDHARLWVERYEGRKTTFDDATRDAYRDALERVVIPHFKRKPLARITPPDVRAFYAHMRDDLNLARATRSKYAAPLKILFTEAVQDGLLSSNPAHELRIIGLSKREKAKAAIAKAERKPKTLPPALVEPLMDALDVRKRDLLLVLAFTGLRISEVCGLQWRDFDHDAAGRPVLNVERQWNDGAYKDHPKTAAGVRTVRLGTPVVRRLLELRAERGNPAPTAPLLANQIGRPYNDHNVRRALRAASKQIGLPYSVTPHQLRHTIASLLYEQGWTDVQVAKMLGHEDANFTRARYLHVVEDGDMGALDIAYGLGDAAAG
jgi:integrase